MQRYSLGPVLLMAASVLVLTHCEQGITLGSETDDLSVSMGAPKEQVYIRFTGDEEHGISLDEAEQKIEAFQNNNPFESHAWYFSAQSIKMILAQNACVGIRIYGGFASDGHFSPVIYGVTADGDDIGRYTLKKGFADSTLVLPMDMPYPCPPFCGGIEDNGQ